MPQQSLHTPAEHQQRRAAIAGAIVGCVALIVAMGIGRFAFTPILPMMQADAGVSIAGGGWLAAANYLGYLVGALAAARVSIAPMKAIRTGLLAVALATAGMAFVHGFTPWIVLRAAAGIASAWIMVFVSTWSLQQIAAARTPLLNGVVFGGVGAGMVLVGLLCVVLLRAGASSAHAWLVIAIVAAAASAAIWSRLRGGQAAPAQQANAAAIVATQRYRLIVAYGLCGFGYIVPATFLPSMAREVLRDPSLFAWAWPLFGAAAMASTLLAAPAARAVGPRTVWLFAQSLMAAGVALPLVVHGAWGVMLSAFIVGGTFMVTTMAGLQEGREVGGEGATRLIGAMTASFAVGQLVGPVIVSSVARFVPPFSVVIPVASAALLVGAWLVSTAAHPVHPVEGAPS